MRQSRSTILDGITEDDYASLLSFAKRFANSTDETMDAVQEAFRQALEKQDQIRDPTRLMAWLRTTAKREVFHQKQYYAKLISGAGVDLGRFSSEGDIERALMRQLLFQQVAKTLNKAAPVYGAILRMYYREGLSFVEISYQLGMSAGTVRSYHKRILKRLRKSLKAL